MKKHHSEGKDSIRASRREFLRQVTLIAGGSIVPAGGFGKLAFSRPLPSAGSDEDICAEKFDLAVRESLADRPVGEIIVAVGISFLGTPYASHTLEAAGPERLIANLGALDCVTFVETSLALSRCIRLRKHSLQHFQEQLQRVRYRGGVINGYSSRLHYFSDWIRDNEQKGIVRDITGEIGGVPYGKTIDFMSKHPESYRQLSDRSTLEEIRTVEDSLNKQNLFFLPKEKLSERSSALQPGDIIGITTTVGGLDISHTGLAVHMNGLVKYLHAPLSGGTVQISDGSLSEYLATSKGRTGVMVARPLEPA